MVKYRISAACALAFFLLLCGGEACFAQFVMSGRVVDSAASTPLAGAHVALRSLADSSSVAETMTGSEGNFSLQGVPEGVYVLRVNYLGYKDHLQRIRVEESISAVGMIRMSLDIASLEAVEVVGKPVAVVLKGDTTEFNAGAYATQPYADADELIKRLPGIEMNPDGTVKAQGEDVRRILVDGKEFFGGDPRVVMKNLPADIIAKVQLIDDQTEQAKFTGFEDGERIKTINIVTREDRRRGYFGKAAAGAGSLNRYNTGGNVHYFDNETRVSLIGVTNNVNRDDFSMQDVESAMDSDGDGGGNTITTSAGINYNDEWNDRTELEASYFYNSNDYALSRLRNREYLLAANANQFSSQNRQSGSENYRHSLDFELEHEIDSMNSISFEPEISFRKSARNSSSASETLLGNSQPLNSSNSNNSSESNEFEFEGELNYRHRFRKRGRTFSVNLDASTGSSRSNSGNYSLNRYFEDGDDVRLDTIDQLNNSSSRDGRVSARLAYTEPLNRFSRLQFSYRFRNTSRYAEREAYDYLASTGRYDLLNIDLSNRFRNDYLYQGTGLEYQFRKEEFFIEFGAGYQFAGTGNHELFPEESSAKRYFHSFLPEASLRYRFSRDRRLRLSYETDTDPPSIRDLQDVIDNSSPLNLRGGNPDLRQEFRHDLSVDYSSVDRETSEHFSASFSADISANQVVGATFIAAEDSLIGNGIILGKGARFTRPENVDGYYSMRSHISYGIPIEALKINLNLNTNLRHVHDIGLLNNTPIYSNSYSINQGVSVYSNIDENTEFGVRTRINYNIVRNNRQGELNSNYFSQQISADASHVFWKGLHIASNIGYRYNKGLSEGYDQGFLIWNAFIGKKLLKQQNAEITLAAYDILNNNTSIDRNVNERYVEDTQTNILKQYFLLSFSYHLRKFGLNN